MQTDCFVSQPPFIDITDAVLDSWKQDQLADTETSLTGIITSARNHSHHALANRALVRARLALWDLAIEDAKNVSLCSLSHTLLFILNYYKSIKIHPSVNAYIAQSLALIGRGEKAEGCRVYDLAFRHYHTIDVDLILLLKVCILHAVELIFCQLLISLRLSSFSWPENMKMRLRVSATSLPRSPSTHSAI